MLRQNLLLIFRSFKKDKSTFLINLVGLSSGLGCALLIYLWVNDEWNVDKFHHQDNRLLQVMKNNIEPQGVQTGEDTPGLLAVSLAGEIPEVEKAVSVFPPAGNTFKGILSTGDKQIKASSKFADKDFFHIFSYQLISGSKEYVLSDKFNVVISEKLATNLFHSTENVIGKTLEWKGERNEGQFRVSGVFENPPESASIQFDILFSYALLVEDNSPNILKWGNSGPSTYVLLKEGANVAEFNNKTKLIFNEAAIERMGITDPVGKTVSLWGEEQQIIGVVKNFHFESLYENVNPFFFRLSPNAGNILLKIQAGKEQETLALLADFYKEFNMGLPFEYMFLDEDFQMLYSSETWVSVLSRYFAALAILISCLGLFGLAAFSAERRIKEIGIRKVMGAGEWGIVRLLSGDFAKMVGVSIVLALPFSYYVSNSWLEGFAYKIDLEWWYFVGAGLLTMGIALLTVSGQAIGAAVANPVESLRSD